MWNYVLGEKTVCISNNCSNFNVTLQKTELFYKSKNLFPSDHYLLTANLKKRHGQKTGVAGIQYKN
jgi:hypothetical protein